MPRKKKVEEEEESQSEEEEVLPKKRTRKPSLKSKEASQSSQDSEDEDKPKKRGSKKAKESDGKEEVEAVPPVVTDFTQPAKKEGDLKIVSWNIAGFKAILGKGFEEYVTKEDPDIICLQETKIAPEGVSAELLPGYQRHFYAAAKKGQHGTGVFSKVAPIAWTDGIGDAEHDTEGRVITAEYENFYLVNTYIPNSGSKLKELEYRKKWDPKFLEYLQKLDKIKPVIWCGDLNVAHEEIDLKNPKPNKNKTPGFADAEREGFSNVLKAGFVDSYRHLYPTEVDCYTFWTYKYNSRAKNTGWRLDYFVIPQRMVPNLSDVYRRPHIMGSDHCPLVLHVSQKPLEQVPHVEQAQVEQKSE
eukprot:TRINITY_DN11384_c0_g1_i1.p1 TRINITY_DN11384_c0_g1~~TRINITY_DN11384_c0_g1_i1.p1  ORF type:complete len:358 (+),score=105.55 TRINITY_DN11384_c0_g1_i1:15-1088(+)